MMVMILCQHPRPFDSFSYQVEGSEMRQSRCITSLFLRHCSYDMMGSWKDFPSFAGICAVWLIRNTPTFENNLSPYFIHCNAHGSCTETDKESLRMWVQDILRPDQTARHSLKSVCVTLFCMKISVEMFHPYEKKIYRHPVKIIHHYIRPF